jgi:hypothetical protein
LVINGLSQDNIFKNDTGCQTGGKRNVDSVLWIQKTSSNTVATGTATLNIIDGSDSVTWD